MGEGLRAALSGRSRTSMSARLDVRIDDRIVDGPHGPLRCASTCPTPRPAPVLMGIHIVANKCPLVCDAVFETVETARRAATANSGSVLASGAFFTEPRVARAMADEFLARPLGEGCEAWDRFYEFRKIGFDECENFDYESYKANGFQAVDPQEASLRPEPRGLAL